MTGTVATEGTPVEPTPGTPEYDAAMAAKFDKATTPPAPPATPPAAEKPAKPEGVPDKFWDAEKGEIRTDDLLKSYQELEKAKATPPKADDPPKEGTPPTELSDAEKAAQAAVESVGLDFTPFSQEFAEKGELSEDSFKKLSDKGIPREMVQDFIAGQQALSAQREAKAFSAVGGKEQFDRAATWASQNLSAAELEAYNKGVNGTEAEMLQAVQGLNAKYAAANGSEPKLLGGNPGGSNTAGFRSQAEMTAAMSDPRYEKDAAYRQDVINKLAATTAF
jgi:hypothetical protein